MHDKPVELNKVKTPIYFLSTIEDHIAPWKTTFLGTDLVGGDVEFVLGGSGHIAGVINPPAKNKRNHWTNGEMGQGADHWLKQQQIAQDLGGIIGTSGLINTIRSKCLRRQIGTNKEFKEIVPAPGDCVRVRL